MRDLLLSVVIANYNYGRYLKDAIESVTLQDMGDKVELIICDAASTDNSVEVIKNYANGLPSNTSYSDWVASHPSLATNNQLLTTKITWWCSEKDGGQSAAFNKGFLHSQGRFLTWLNADDVLMPGALKAFEKAVAAYPDCKWFVGGALWLDKLLRVVKCGCGRKFSAARANMGNVHVWGPSSFFSRDLYEQAGGVDERFFYMMDTDLWSKFYHQCHEVYMPFVDYAWGLRLHEQAKMSAHNFAESGQANPDHPKWAQIEKEKRIIEEEVFAPKRRMGLLSKILTSEFCKALKSRIDSFRFRGKDYRDCVK